jgi:hypothetical protein
MAQSNGGMMADLQMRMSKKIAQLTKVIYHLNNKNEDHDMDLAEMADQYESEIETVLRDTADKLNAFQVSRRRSRRRCCCCRSCSGVGTWKGERVVTVAYLRAVAACDGIGRKRWTLDGRSCACRRW